MDIWHLVPHDISHRIKHHDLTLYRVAIASRWQSLSPIDIADQPTTLEIICARAHVGCFVAIVVLLYWPGSQPLQQQQTFIDELTPMLERVKFDVVFMHRIVSYRKIFCDIISYCIVFP